MRILLIASANNWDGQPAPFILEQAESIINLGYDVEFYNIKGKGWRSYLKHAGILKAYLEDNSFDIIHAHFVWSALVAVLQRKVPVVATFHGSDLCELPLRLVSRFIVYPLAKHCIVVNNKMQRYLPARKTSVVPCGVDIDLFSPMNKTESRETLGLNSDKLYVLFSSKFSRPEKNYSLAKAALSNINRKVEIIEFDGYNREQSARLYSAVDLLLLTSVHEGSPQVIKEALACNCPIISTDVGDVKAIMGETVKCFTCNFDSAEISNRIEQILSHPTRTNGRERLMTLNLSLAETAQKIAAVYLVVLKMAKL
jgi:teichuronic acid biosynthesis glycosyltransferase TuaC